MHFQRERVRLASSELPLDTQANLIAGRVNVQRFSPQVLHGIDGRQGPATWLVLVGMTDQASSNHIRLWRSGWLPPPPLLCNIHTTAAPAASSPPQRGYR